jgi:D-alanine-D-alanine ligase
MMKKFQHIAVLKGGPSAEREVSLNSGKAVASGLRTSGYTVDEIDVTAHDFSLDPSVEAVFIALHGDFGEDGGVQTLLHERNIPYTGTRFDKMPLSFDKRTTKKLLVKHGLPTAPYEVLSRGEARTLALPAVIKPPVQGSSIGVHRVLQESEWAPALDEAFGYDQELLVESFVRGREFTVGMLGDDALPIIEIVAPEGNYDYAAKYTSGMTEYLVPAPISQSLTERMKALAMETFRVLGGRDLGRVDFMVNEAEELFILELNTIPGFTETSLLPKAARYSGLSFPDLCGRIMEMASVE